MKDSFVKHRVYLDTNVFIEVFEKDGPMRTALWRFFEAAHALRLTLVTSELTLAELCVDPIRKGNSELLNEYRFLIESRGTVMQAVPVSREILEKSADCRARLTSLRLPDAIHLATALMEKCKWFVTDDQRFSKAAAKDQALNINFIGFDARAIENLIQTVNLP